MIGRSSTSKHSEFPSSSSEIEEGRRLPARIRKQRVIATIRKVGFVSVADLASDLSVSEMTIRRDLNEMERAGHLIRAHGGAVAPEGQQTLDRDEPVFDTRLPRNQRGKEKIAAAALGVIGEAKTIALDVGTTTYCLASLLVKRPDTKKFTNSLRIAMLLATEKQEVYLPPGPVRSDELSISGPAAVQHFERLWFDLAFIGVSGMTETGFFDYSIEEVEMKRVLIRRSAKRVVLCDASKFDRMSLVQVAAMDEIHMLITDAAPPPGIGRAMEASRVTLLIAPDENGNI